MYLGRYQLGGWIDIYLQVLNATRTPLMPDAVPVIRIYSATGLVKSDKMPIVDKVVSPGLFCSRIFLGNPFDNGQHTVTMAYSISGAAKMETRNFDVMPAGNPLGQVIGMWYFHQPAADYVLFQAESGRILRGKNPRTL